MFSKIPTFSFVLILIFLLLTCSGCTKNMPELINNSTQDEKPLETTIISNQEENINNSSQDDNINIDGMILDLVPLADTPALSTVLAPVASGTIVYQNSKATIDASNSIDGYVMIKFLGGGNAKIKVLLTGPSGTTYTYNLKSTGEYEVFPLSDGNGNYSIGIYQNVNGTKYATVFSTSIYVSMTDQFAPFLRPNQYVNFTSTSKAVVYAAELTKDLTNTISKVSTIYNYVINNYTYDKQLATTVTSGYLPNIDNIYDKKSGICFDYAALMTAMLRSQGIPVKLVIGYTGQMYHAWINVYTEESGWIDNVIFFNGSEWKLMDPTFASNGKSSSSIMNYINNETNYTARYLY